MLFVIRGGRKAKDLVGYVKVELENPLPVAEISLGPKLTPSKHMPEIGVLTRTYFAEGQVSDCPNVTGA